MNTHGNQYAKGFPDKYCYHRRFGQRWVELKYLKSYHFTKAQMKTFPLIDRCKIGIWILVDGTEEEYAKLFDVPNWKTYLKKSEIVKIKRAYPWFKEN